MTDYDDTNSHGMDPEDCWDDLNQPYSEWDANEDEDDDDPSQDDD